MGAFVSDAIRMATIAIRNIEKSNKVVTRLRSASIDKIRIVAVKSNSRFNPLRRLTRHVVRIVSSPKIARIKMNSSPFKPLQSPQNRHHTSLVSSLQSCASVELFVENC